MAEIDDIISAKRAVEEDLLKLPGVIGVGVGLREVGGQLTDEVVIRVYVEKKLPAAKLAPEHVIPAAISGHRTDVIESERPTFVNLPGDFLERPLACGLQIARYAGFLGVQGFAGTIGCFVRPIPKPLNPGETPPIDADNMLLTCAHVLFPDLVHDVTMSDDIVYQNESILGANSIGVADRNLCHFGDTADAAIAHSGADFGANNYVWKIGDITGVAQPQLGGKVSKFGRTTGLTSGMIIDVHHTCSIAARNGSVWFYEQILVLPSGDGSFVEPGDSGSALLNEARQIVGLLGAQSGSSGIANNIANVFACLNVQLA